LHRIGPAKFAVRGHDLSGNQIINGCAVLAHEPTQSAAQSKPRDASVGDGAARGSKAVGLCRSIEFPPQHTTLGARGAVYRIRAEPFMDDRSMTMPPSLVPYPGALCPRRWPSVDFGGTVAGVIVAHRGHHH
jgi:hypothetical protein